MYCSIYIIVSLSYILLYYYYSVVSFVDGVYFEALEDCVCWVSACVDRLESHACIFCRQSCSVRALHTKLRNTKTPWQLLATTNTYHSSDRPLAANPSIQVNPMRLESRANTNSLDVVLALRNRWPSSKALLSLTTVAANNTTFKERLPANGTTK